MFKGNKMKKQTMSDFYVTTTISIPQGDEDKYRLSIDENTKFVDFIYDKIKQEPDMLKVKPEYRSIGNFKFHKTHTETFKDIKKILSKYHVSFSNIYRKLYSEFVTSTLKN